MHRGCNDKREADSGGGGEQGSSLAPFQYSDIIIKSFCFLEQSRIAITNRLFLLPHNMYSLYSDYFTLSNMISE